MALPSRIHTTLRFLRLPRRYKKVRAEVNCLFTQSLPSIPVTPLPLVPLIAHCILLHSTFSLSRLQTRFPLIQPFRTPNSHSVSARQGQTRLPLPTHSSISLLSMRFTSRIQEVEHVKRFPLNLPEKFIFHHV